MNIQGVQNGFTLIEIMIVVAIMGILSSIAVPAYQEYVRRSHVVEGMQLASGTKTEAWDFYAVHGKWPVDNADLGIPNASSITGNSVTSVSIEENVITVTFNDKVTTTGNNTIELSGSVQSGGVLHWNCTGGTLDDIYRPSICR